MPIVREWSVFEGCQLLIWEITESLEDLGQGLIIHPDEWEDYYTISHPQKQLEWLTGRRAMQTLIESQYWPYEGMMKDQYGKPFLRNRVAEISLTHTARYIVVASHISSIGVDLERVAPKIARIASKFLSTSEYQAASIDLDLNTLCTYWCAKEALYKLQGRHGLSFREQIFIDAFTAENEFLSGTIYPTHHKPSTHVLQRFWIEDFCGVVAV